MSDSDKNNGTPDLLPDQLAAYKQSLQAAEQQMQAEYDKGVMTLSGGALGISLAFLKDIVGKDLIHHGYWFVNGWICWAVSIALVLASYFTSTQALRSLAKAVDDCTIYLAYSRCGWTKATKWLNAFSGLAFLGGVICLAFFISFNLPSMNTTIQPTAPQQNHTDGGSETRGIVPSAPPLPRPPPPAKEK